MFSSSGSSAVSSCTGTGWLVDGVDESNCVAALKVSLLCFNFLVGGASAIATTASVLCYTCEIIMWAWQTRKSWGGTGPQCPPGSYAYGYYSKRRLYCGALQDEALRRGIKVGAFGGRKWCECHHVIKYCCDTFVAFFLTRTILHT